MDIELKKNFKKIITNMLLKKWLWGIPFIKFLYFMGKGLVYIYIFYRVKGRKIPQLLYFM